MRKIAVIGMSCLFPGAETPETFIKNLLEQKETTSPPTEKQMGVDPAIFYDPRKGNSDTYYSVRGGYIHDFDFDAAGYQLPADFLSNLDDVYQWSLYVAREALRDSGYLGKRDALATCGVLLGNLSFPTKKSNALLIPIYHRLVEKSLRELTGCESLKLADTPSLQEEDFFNSRISGYPSSVIAQALGLSGPFFSLDAACASSLYSVKLACDYLESGRADLMLAGAVSAGDPFFVNMGFSTFTAYSERDNSYPLDKRSDGLVSGEGAGMFVLKRHEDALRDNDKIYATINGIGVSNDGRGRSVLSPNTKGQLLALERAYHDSDLSPESVSYIECHATGTQVGDIVELQTLETFFGDTRSKPLIGTVKSNFGHLLTCAGMAAMMKVILSMREGVIPATLNIVDPLSSPNDVISARHVAASNTRWPNENGPKYAGVNAFGFGGTNAHLIFCQEDDKETKRTPAVKRSKRPREKKTSSMAIVGMDAFFGSSQSLDDVDHSIYSKISQFIPLPERRWKGIEADKTVLRDYGFEEGHIPHGCYIDHFDLDVLRYKIPPNEVDAMIPQQTLMLRVADNALKDAGLKEGGNVGVIIAMEADPTPHQFRGRIDLSWKVGHALRDCGKSAMERENELTDLAKESVRKAVNVNEFTSFIGNIMASRITALWDFSGPAFTLSSEENSLFRALEIARMLLENGEVDAVVVGAVDLAANVESVLLRQKLSEKLNSGAESLFLNRGTNGWTIGEGAGAVVLKRPKEATDNGDSIYALIDSVELGRGASTGQLKNLCQKSLDRAGVAAADIDYLEVSSPTQELRENIKGVFDAYDSPEKLSCAIGSASANFGYTFAASGMASLIKTALCLHKRYIPGIPGWERPEQPEPWEESPFYFPTEPKPWFQEKSSKRRKAAILGSGLDGVTAHLVLSEEITPNKRRAGFLSQTPLRLFPITANTQSELTLELEKFEKQVQRTDSLSNVARELYVHSERQSGNQLALVILGECKEKLSREIQAAKAGITTAFETGGEWESPQGSYFTATPLAPKGDLAFVYPGAFNSYLGMNRDLFQIFPDLYDLIPTYTSYPDRLFRDRLVFPRGVNAFSDKELTALQSQLDQNAIAVFETGVNAAILNTAVMSGAFGLRPKAVFGYSMGEVSMTFSHGVWGSTDKMSETLRDHPIFKDRLAGPMNAAREAWGLPTVKSGESESIWDCYTISAATDVIREAIKKESHVYLIIINSPNEGVIAGEKKACARVVNSLKYRCVQTPMTDTIHCEFVGAERDSITHLHSSPVDRVPPITFYSAANYGPTKLTSKIIANNIAHIYSKTIDFPRLVKRVYDDNARLFLELGPRSGCSKWIGEILEGSDHLAVSMSRKGADDFTSILRALAKLYSHKVKMDLSLLYPVKNHHLENSETPRMAIHPGGDRIDSAIVNDKTKAAFSPSETEIAPSSADRSQPLPEQITAPISPPVNPPVVSASPVPIQPPGEGKSALSHLGAEISHHRTAISQNHSLFLESRAVSLRLLREMITLQLSLPSGERAKGEASTDQPVSFSGDPYLHPDSRKPYSGNAIWNEEDLLEFAGGSIATVFGPEYSVIDTYPYRVRLPLPPYLLVNRVTELNAKRGEFVPSSLTTEYDIATNAWYSIDGQIPWAIASEAGQCDLLLISYLGIDFSSKGERYYRLTDYTMTFFDELPKEGETLIYKIHIDSFMKNGDALFFNFGYDCYVKEKLIYKMTGGRAGFISNAELAQGKGVVVSQLEASEREKAKKMTFTPLLNCSKTTFSRDELLNITRGNLAACFGPSYDQQGANPSLRFASEEIMMLDRIVSLDTRGGPWGLGEVVAEKDMAPDHWYFPCHFKDDNVLAGTLVTEGCVQLLGFYMLYMGLQVKTRDARFQPIKNRSYAIRARGQIVPKNTRYSYKMEIIEIGLDPKPFARANFFIILEGKVVVDFRDLGIELVEKSPSDPACRQLPEAPHPVTTVVRQEPRFSSKHIDEFATGSLANCFGSDFDIYEGRIAPRTPNGDLQLMSRILKVNGNRHEHHKPSDLIAEYDVPVDAWFFTQNAYPVTPYSILMEIALQPCGFLSTYMGATMIYKDTELRYRNLASDATLHKNIDLRGKTITAKSWLLVTAKAAETIVLNYNYELSVDQVAFYTGNTQFGYFTPNALSQQKGLDKGELIPPWVKRENIPLTTGQRFDLHSPEIKERFYQPQPGRPHYRMAGPQLDFLDEVIIFHDSGKYQQGYIYAFKAVDPSDWFYPCHFYQDPVMPGSLGVEAILQAMRLFALRGDLGKEMRSPHFTNAPGVTKWLYRGQINPENKLMEIEVHIKTITTDQDRIVITADANLWKDNMRIYQITDAAIALVED